MTAPGASTALDTLACTREGDTTTEACRHPAKEPSR